MCVVFELLAADIDCAGVNEIKQAFGNKPNGGLG
jgi:hypothetical protein